MRLRECALALHLQRQHFPFTAYACGSAPGSARVCEEAVVVLPQFRLVSGTPSAVVDAHLPSCCISALWRVFRRRLVFLLYVRLSNDCGRLRVRDGHTVLTTGTHTKQRQQQQQQQQRHYLQHS